MKKITHYSDIFKLATFALLAITPLLILHEGVINGMAVLWMIPLMLWAETNPGWND